MANIKINPCTNGTRNKVKVVSEFGSSGRKIRKKLKVGYSRGVGRSNVGRITVRHKGGGAKRKFRVGVTGQYLASGSARVESVEYDPTRSGFVSIVSGVQTGQQRYVLSAEGLQIGQTVSFGDDSEIRSGNVLSLNAVPEGVQVFNIEGVPGGGGRFARSAGAGAVRLSKIGAYVVVKLPSGESRQFLGECKATIGTVSNPGYRNKRLGKAGASRHRGIRPRVRGAAMNATDHPHGGGEGRAPVGRPGPLTPWGKPALGVKTRRNKKQRAGLVVKKRG